MSYNEPFDMLISNPVGFENAKGENCCYINTIIHSVFYFKEFRQSILALEINGTSKGCLLLSELKNIIQSYNNRYINSTSSSNVLQSLQFRSILADYCMNSSSHQGKFKLFRQDDPVEFLIFILNALHTHHIKPNKSIEPDDDECSYSLCSSHELFYIELIEKCSNTCRAQQKELKYCSNYFVYEIYPVEVISLIKNERLTLNDIKGNLLPLRKRVTSQGIKQCDQCHKKKQLLCLRSSKYLLVNLVTADMTNDKKMIHYLYLMISLNISNKNLFDLIDDSHEKMYDLIGVLLYYNKHYLCAFNDNGKWYLFDDEIIKSYNNWEDLSSKLLRNLYLPVALYYKEKINQRKNKNLFSLKDNDSVKKISKSPLPLCYEEKINKDILSIKIGDENKSKVIINKPSILKVKNDKFSINDTLNNETQFMSRQMSRDPEENYKSNLKINHCEKSLKSNSSVSQDKANDSKKSSQNHHIQFDIPESTSKNEKEKTLKNADPFNSPYFFQDSINYKTKNDSLAAFEVEEQVSPPPKNSWKCEKCKEYNKDDVYCCRNCCKVNLKIQKKIAESKNEKKQKKVIIKESEDSEEATYKYIQSQKQNTIQSHFSHKSKQVKQEEKEEEEEMTLKKDSIINSTHLAIIHQPYQTKSNLKSSTTLHNKLNSPEAPKSSTTLTTVYNAKSTSPPTISSNSTQNQTLINERRVKRGMTSNSNSNATSIYQSKLLQNEEEKKSQSQTQSQMPIVNDICHNCGYTSFYNSKCLKCRTFHDSASLSQQNSHTEQEQTKNKFYIPPRSKN